VGQTGHDKSKGLFSLEKEMKIINWGKNFLHHRTVSVVKRLEFLAIGCYIYF